MYALRKGWTRNEIMYNTNQNNADMKQHRPTNQTLITWIKVLIGRHL